MGGSNRTGKTADGHFLSQYEVYYRVRKAGGTYEITEEKWDGKMLYNPSTAFRAYFAAVFWIIRDLKAQRDMIALELQRWQAELKELET